MFPMLENPRLRMNVTAKATFRGKCKLPSIEFRDTYILCTISGLAVHGELMSLFRNLCEAAAEKGFNRIVVDCRQLQAKLSTADKYMLGAEIAARSQQLNLSARIAVVGWPPLVDGFGALVASNRGLRAQVFRDLNDAISWAEGEKD
jgi:hypothetical protein